MAEELKNRYSDEELAEFKTIIEEMLSKAKAEYNTYRELARSGGANDVDDTSPSFKTVEDDGAMQRSKEEASQLAQRISSYRTSRQRSFASRTRLMACAVLPVSSSLRKGSGSFLTLPLP